MRALNSNFDIYIIINTLIQHLIKGFLPILFVLLFAVGIFAVLTEL